MRYVSSKGMAVVCGVALQLLLAATAFPQASDLTQLSGLVTDPSDAVVAGARATVTHQGTGAERTSVTNASGYYTVQALPSGLYTISVEAPGFKKFQTQDNKLDPGIPARVDVRLEVGAVTEVVQVTATANPAPSRGGNTGQADWFPADEVLDAERPKPYMAGVAEAGRHLSIHPQFRRFQLHTSGGRLQHQWLKDGGQCHHP